MKSKILKIIGAILIVFLMLNPETIHIALLIDGAGLEVIIILLQIQLASIVLFIRKNYIRPGVKFLAGFRAHSFFLHPWRDIFDKPTLIGFALPSAATGMYLLVVSVMLSCI